MPLELIVGPPNSGRAEEVQTRLRSAAGAEPVLVVPTGDDAAWFERELCAATARPWVSRSAPSAGSSRTSRRPSRWTPGPLLTAPQRLALIRAAISPPTLAAPRAARRSGPGSPPRWTR